MSDALPKTENPHTTLSSLRGDIFPLGSKLQVFVIARCENTWVVCDDSDWGIIRHSKGDIDVQSLGVSFIIDSNVLVETNPLLVITLLPAMRIRTCKFPPDFGWEHHFSLLSAAIQSKSASIFVTVQTKGSRLICTDKVGDAIQVGIFNMAPPVDGRYILVNVGFRQRDQRVWCSFDLAKAYLFCFDTFCMPPQQPHFVDRSPSVQVFAGKDVQQLQKNSVVDVPTVDVIALSTFTTRSRGTIQHIKFRFPNDPSVTLITIFDSLRFAPEGTTQIQADGLTVSEFNQQKTLVVTATTLIEYIGAPQAPQAPQAVTVIPTRELPQHKDLVLIDEGFIEERPLKASRIEFQCGLTPGSSVTSTPQRNLQIQGPNMSQLSLLTPPSNRVDT